ncbi:MAG: NACHT domain-containing NTPase [Mojavia pulchra JT2-VF2]|jgi:predicted NACHT family NTPase|uniref:NACHT domain-containing NTPase n=1 Tax=Mojavia pulchra JT2-VF2 TaxID=287848 RepID=A0A951UJM6_9NOST|nr:NACHT domain-containing NTPase [Mojavia pulchra JT2-VF2]
MARSSRSLQASTAGLKTANDAFKLKGWTKEYFRAVVGCSRPTLKNFFDRQPVENGIFQAICTELGLKWEEIAELKTGEEKPDPTIDDLVNEVRKKVSADIQKRCGFMRVLDMTHPIGLNDIYTDVNILEKITGRRRLEIAQLLEKCNSEDFERFGLNQVVEKRVPGLAAVEQNSKLMILGKPGAGKTTFLKRIAIQCNSGQFLGNYVPIFITLKDFAETPQQPSLLQYINNQFVINKISDQEITKTLLEQGRIIILLDGLDEVTQAYNDRVLREIRDFSTQYDANYFVVTCRIASKEYTFERFTEVEVADFDDKQIAEFATKWFQTKDPKKAEHFIQKLQQNQRIKELATNPLLLTLLCLLFGESTDFPSNRAELYEEGVEVLLKKWDGTRSIERDLVYQKLSLKRKEDLLSKIALETFVDGNYFFKERLVEEYISDYIQNLPDAQTDPEALLLDSKAVLKSIEAQHGLLVERARGIYSFSHLTFHEFFTARNIDSQQTFQQLVSHITDKRWREVFLLTVGMLKNSDDLLQLMKQQIDKLLAGDEKLQQFLTWINEKSRSVKNRYKPVAVRAFYLSLTLSRPLDPTLTLTLTRTLSQTLSQTLTRTLSQTLSRTLDLDLALALDLTLSRTLDLDLTLDLALALDLTLSLTLTRTLSQTLSQTLTLALDLKLKRSLQQLKDQLPDRRVDDKKLFEHWWQENGHAWAEELRSVMIKHRNIGHDWQFNDDQKQLLRQYYDANKLLVDCLNSECYVSRSVRQEIEDTLLLPVKPQQKTIDSP